MTDYHELDSRPLTPEERAAYEPMVKRFREGLESGELVYDGRYASGQAQGDDQMEG